MYTEQIMNEQIMCTVWTQIAANIVYCHWRVLYAIMVALVLSRRYTLANA